MGARPCLRLLAQELIEFELEAEEGRGGGAAEDKAGWAQRARAGLRLEAGEDVDLEPARRELECLGAVELEPLMHELGLALPFDADPRSAAEFLIDPSEDLHAIAEFLGRGLERLRGQGWAIEIDPSFPYRDLGELPLSWRARHHGFEDQGDHGDVGSSSARIGRQEGPGWFELELGVKVGGEFVDLLPALVELVQARGGRLSGPQRARTVTLPVGGGRLLRLPKNTVHSLLEIVRELHEIEGAGGSGGRAKIPAFATHYLDALDALGADELPSGKRVKRGLAAGGQAPVGDAPKAAVGPGLRATLRPYQAQGLAWLQGLSKAGAGGVLADDMGLGKTLQTIAHLEVLRGGKILGQPALVVGPKSLVSNWQRELRRFAPSLRVVNLAESSARSRRAAWRSAPGADILITSYPRLLRDADELEAQSYCCVVFDEAQALKNPRSRLRRAAARLEADQVVCLSGTPVENRLGELWSLVDLVVPGLLGSPEQFRARFAEPIEEYGDEDRLAMLRRRVAPYLLRRLKSEVVEELPPKIRSVHSVSLEKEQRELYEGIRIAAHDSVRKAIRQKGIAQASVDILAALTKLRQVCCDPRLVDMEAAGETQESAKLESLLELLGSLLDSGRRVLIFSQFTSMLALISEALAAREWRHLVLTGQSQKRQELCDRFESGEADIFLISLKAGGTGLNLVSADTVIHFDPWWNPAAQAQATDRAYRIGQTKTVHEIHLIVEGSVESRMLDLQEHKRALAEGVLEKGGGLDPKELESLFSA